MAVEEGFAGGVLGDGGRDSHLCFWKEREGGGYGTGCQGGFGGEDGGEGAVAVEAVGVGFAEEDGGLGEGAELGEEFFVWDVLLARYLRAVCSFGRFVWQFW